MRIRILIPLWKRPEVTLFCFEHLKKLQAQSKHHIDVLCVISEPEYIKICNSFGFNWVFAENNPLGKKINTGVKHSLKFSYDYLMIMNSDDVIKAELIDSYYKPFFDKLCPFFGIDKVTYVNFKTKEAREFSYEFSVLGIGKCIYRDIVKKLNGELYVNERNRGLDDSMMDRMIHSGYWPEIVKYEGQLAMDFKSEVNIWPWEQFKDKGKEVCYQAV